MPEEKRGASLAIASLVTGYARKAVLNGVTLDIAPSEVVALIGHNGAGKSTVLRAAFGLLPVWQGGISLDGTPVAELAPWQRLQRGMSYVPQGNRVFGNLTAAECLRLAGASVTDRARLHTATERVFELFPALRDLRERRSRHLSGGEKQMLALAMGLMVSPRLLLLDEPSLGLAPNLVDRSFQRVRQIVEETGATVLVVEQKVRKILEIADRVYVLRNGTVSFSGPAVDLLDDERLRAVYL